MEGILDLNELTTFEKESVKANNIIEITKLTYLKLFNKENENDLFLHYILIAKDNLSVCGKVIDNVGCWRCNDCVKHSNTIFCQDCWETMKDKHKGHNISYIISIEGTCDCGDNNYIDKKYFCNKHKGHLVDEEEIKAYINSCISEDVSSFLTEINRNLIKEMAKYIIKAMNDEKTDTLTFQAVMVNFVKFLTVYTSNRVFIHIIAPLLLEKYPYKTKHVCLDLGKKEKDMKLVSSSLFNHDCKCPFLRLLMRFWPLGHTNLLYSFLNSYKLRKAMGYLYILLYEDILLKISIDLYKFGAYIFFDEVCENACNTEGLIELMFNGLIEAIKFAKLSFRNVVVYNDIVVKAYKLLSTTMNKLMNDTMYLLKPICMKKLGSREKIYMYLIDSMVLIHNLNSVEIFPFSEFSGGKFNSDLLFFEICLLEVFSLYVSILHFDDKKLIKNIFTYFSNKIYSEQYKVLGKNEYSCHIPLFRCFSILLNRYCFYYADKNKTDIFSGLNDAIKLIPNYKEVFKIMLNSLYKVFGFITACGESFFDEYDKNMVQYEMIYYSNKELVYRDFSLMKYLFACKENKEYFSFSYILKLSQVDNSNIFFENYLFNNENEKPPANWLDSGNKKLMQISGKILRIILNILRNNTCLIWNLGNSYFQFINNKMEDKLMKSIIDTNKNNFIELTIELMINKIMTQQNLSYYTDIYDSIYFCIIECLGKDLIKDLILAMTNKTLTQDKKAKFSIKNEYLKLIDINYISSPKDQSLVEKYIIEFKKNQISIFNVHFYPINIFEIKLSKENYKQIFFYEDNFDFLFRFTELILKREEYFNLQEFMLNVLLNFLSTFFHLDDSTFIFFRENINNKIMELKNILENNNLTDEMQKSYCLFIVGKISEHDKINNISKTEKSTNSDNNNKINNAGDLTNINTNKIKGKNVPPPSNKKSSMKEKMKNKFKKKNDNLVNKYGLQNSQIEEKKDKEACIYCLKPIEDDDITKPYGKLGNILRDNYLTNAFYQVVKKEYEKYCEKDENLFSPDEVNRQKNNKKNRIISCNHKIHFSCYFKAFMKSDLKKSINLCKCPLCNKISCTFIPSLNGYTNEQTFGVFLGYDVEYVMKLGEKKFDYYNNLEKNLLEEVNDTIEEIRSERNNNENNSNNNKNNQPEEDEFQRLKNIEEEEGKDNSNKISDVQNDNLLSINEANFKNNYKDLIISCKHFIEGFFARTYGLDVVDLESNESKNLFKIFLIYYSVQYRDFIVFFENTGDKKTIFDIWKNFILSVKLLIKLNILDREHYFTSFYKLIKHLKDFSFDIKSEHLIRLDYIKIYLFQILFLILLFFDYSEIEGYEKYLIYYALTVSGFEFFYREIYIKNSLDFNKEKFIELMNEEGLYKYLNEGISEKLNIILRNFVLQLFITKILLKNEQQINYEKLSLNLNDMLDNLNLSDLKNKTFIQILDYLEKILTINENEKKIFNYLKPIKNYKDFYKELISVQQEEIKLEKCDTSLNLVVFGACLPIIHNFINLPKTAIELEYNYYNVPCKYCEKIGKQSLICLDCGEKVCDSRSCLVKIEGEGNVTEPGFVNHCKECGGGSAAFLQTSDCSVLFMYNEAVFKKFIPLYVNEFGEGITKTVIGSEFKLNEEEVKNTLKMYTNYSYSNAPVIL